MSQISFLEGLPASLPEQEITDTFAKLLTLPKEEIYKHNQEIAKIVPTVLFKPDFITEEEENYLMEHLSKHVLDHGEAAMRKKIVGAGNFAEKYKKRIHETFGDEFNMERCYVNFYEPNAVASAHFDNIFFHSGPQAFICIGSTSIVELTNMTTDRVYPLVVDRRCFYCMMGEMEYKWLHALNYKCSGVRMSLLFNRGGSMMMTHHLDSEKVFNEQEFQQKMMKFMMDLQIPDITPQDFGYVVELATHGPTLNCPELFGIRHMKFSTYDECLKLVKALLPIGRYIFVQHRDLRSIVRSEFLELWNKNVLSDPTLFVNDQLPPPPPSDILYDVFKNRLPVVDREIKITGYNKNEN